MERDIRQNPGLLKLDLYCRGLRVDDSFFSSTSNARQVMRTRAGLGSGLELILPDGLWTNVPVTESFAADSPYILFRENDELIIRRDGDREHIATVTAAPKPEWYERQASSGRAMRHIGSLQGTYLGIYPTKVCDFWLVKPEKSNCKFCSVGLNLGVDDADEKSLDEVLEVVLAARDESGITYVDFNTGHYEGDTYLDALEPYIRRVKAETGLLVGVQSPPHHDLSKYDHLKEMGVNRVSFCFEIWDRERFADVCPGKSSEYGLDRYLEAIRYCSTLADRSAFSFDPWVSNGEIIAGLEPAEESIKAIDWITSVGAVPTVCVFRPLAGTDYRHEPPPKTEDMIPVFARLYESCMDRGLPIGIAPNIHVSLVLLPEEGRYFTDHPRRYRWKELKRRTQARLYRRHFLRQLEAKDRTRKALVEPASVA